MDQLSRIPRVGGQLLLGLALGLLWGAIGFLVHGAVAHAEDDGTAGDGLRGVVTRSVPALTGVTEAAESAVHSTTVVVTATVEALPPLGHLSDPVLEPVVEQVIDPVVDSVLVPVVTAVEQTLEPVLDPILDGVPPILGPIEPVLPEPAPTASAGSTASAVPLPPMIDRVPGGEAPHPSAAEAALVPVTPGDVPVPRGDAPMTPATAGSATSSAAQPADAQHATGPGAAPPGRAAPLSRDQAPPGPAQPTDTTPD